MLFCSAQGLHAAKLSMTVKRQAQLSLQFNVLLIAFFNWYYTFLQLEPKDLAEQLKRQVPAFVSSDSCRFSGVR